MAQPMVSVLMTAYNREKFIGEAIASVLKSSWRKFELIIVDDCSGDNTVSIARHFTERDNRIKLYVNGQNLGQFKNRNKAASLATGDYIVHVDSDDTIFPDGIERLVNIMELNPECSFGMYSPENDTVRILSSHEAISEHFFKRPFLTHGPGGTILRRKYLDEIGRYPVDYGIPGDMYFNLNASCFTSVVLIPFQFMYYRRHEDQEINNTYDYLYNNYKYMNHALKQLPLPISEEQKHWLHKKNKRRFSVNILKYFISTFNVGSTMQAVKKAEFKLVDFINGIFHR